MEKDQIKLAFSRVKKDVQDLQNEFLGLRDDLSEIRSILRIISDDINTLKLHKIDENNSLKTSQNTQTDRQMTSTYPVTSTHTSTVPQEIEGLKSPNLGISTGNEGASTDRQTDNSTDKYTQIPSKNNIEHNIQEASEILDSLDRLKKEIRLKFKFITNQEMAVFSTIYQLEEQNPEDATYSNVANTLKLSESSIRDYVQRMINKGIPIKKQKSNNKKIILSISQDLKKIATLSTIIQLRDL